MNIMFSEFAYSQEMQTILMFFSFAYNFVLMYFIAKLILRIYGEEASVRQKALFAFLTGTILQSVRVYVIYFIGGMVSFTKVQNLLFATPNPITALLYCYVGIKTLRLSPKRSIELMGHVYLYLMMIHALNRLAGSLLFVQDAARFNYMLDGARHFFNLAISLVIYWLTCRVLDRNPALLVASKTSSFATPQKDLVIFVAKALLIYLCVVLLPLLIPSTTVANGMIFVLLMLFFAATLLYNFYQHEKADNRNKDAYIHSLIKTSDEFRTVKHDFYNILQTYSGYLAVGDIEACRKYHASLVGITTQAGDKLNLSRRIGENPTLISLLIDKHERAEQMGVRMNVSLKCPLDLPMDPIHLSRAIACLLDNAIEASSESEQKRVFFTIEWKSPVSRLIIITNSALLPLDVSQMLTAGQTSKAGHEGIGLNNVRKILDGYSNCTFQLNHYNNEVTAYVELKQGQR